MDSAKIQWCKKYLKRTRFRIGTFLVWRSEGTTTGFGTLQNDMSGSVENIIVIWYNFPVLVCCTKKNLATLPIGDTLPNLVTLLGNHNGTNKKLDTCGKYYCYLSESDRIRVSSRQFSIVLFCPPNY
jgi:hypothetical protein